MGGSAVCDMQWAYERGDGFDELGFEAFCLDRHGDWSILG